jgi:hypothetical protein
MIRKREGLISCNARPHLLDGASLTKSSYSVVTVAATVQAAGALMRLRFSTLSSSEKQLHVPFGGLCALVVSDDFSHQLCQGRNRSLRPLDAANLIHQLLRRQQMIQ